jgi:large subunit ribosomal protein L10
MAKTREQKSAHLNELLDVAKNSQSVVFVSFDKLPVKDETSLRATLTKNNVKYKVAKKSLLKKAFGESSIEGSLPELKGMVAVAYGSDLIAPAREVYTFQKELAEKLQIVGGVFEGKFMTQAEMMSIATIPSTPVLYSQLLSMFNAPIQSFVSVLHQYAEKKQA